MLKIGFVGWRGMVGSVLMERMREEGDFGGFEAIFFSTSNVGGKGPDVGLEIPPLQDAYDLKLLSSLDIIVTCQGSEYTKRVYPELRNKGWNGYWIDSSSALRMSNDSIIVLDPVNKDVIDKALSSGIKTYVGGNCTVSLMLMALSGLFREGLVEWLSSMTYQAASGAGARHMIELVKQMIFISDACRDAAKDPAVTAIALDRVLTERLRAKDIPCDNFGIPLVASLIPWIDSPMGDGSTREEWKGFVETNKILQAKEPIPVDGICVRVGSMRCHSQAFTIKLKKDISLEIIEEIIKNGNKWVKLIPNEKDATLKGLTPAVISGTLDIAIGRIRKMKMGSNYVAAFTVGDQLLWGAAEPIRRILNIIQDFCG